MFICLFKLQFLAIIVHKMLIWVTISRKQKQIFTTYNFPQFKNLWNYKMPEDNSTQTLIQAILIPSLPTFIIRTEMNNFHTCESLPYIFYVLIKNNIDFLRIRSGVKNASNHLSSVPFSL